MSSEKPEVVENLEENQAVETTGQADQLAEVATEVEESQAKGTEAKALVETEGVEELQQSEADDQNQAAEPPSSEEETDEEETLSSEATDSAEEAASESTEESAVPQKSLRELKEEELAQVNEAVSSNNLLFYSPNMDEIMEQLRAEKEARRQAEEAERRERRLADLDPEITSHRRRRRRRGDADLEFEGGTDGDPEDTIVKVRAPRLSDSHSTNRVTGVRGSTRLEAKRIRRRETRATGRRRQIITEAEFLARRESVDRQMLVRQKDDRIQIGVLEDGVLAEHFVSKTQQDSLIGNVYLGKVQNVLPSMEAAFVDIGRGRNAVLYAGEVNWDVTGLDGAPRKIENALKAGDSVLVQVTKDPVGHKGARLTSQVSLPGRYLVYVPGGSMTGISRKLPDVERQRLKKILKDRLPEDAGVIVRTAAEGASEEELSNDINRLRVQWEEIKAKSESRKVLAPELLYQEPDLTIKTVRDVFNEDFTSMMVQGSDAWDSIEAYVTYVAPDLLDRLKKWEEDDDLFDHYRIEEQLAKALDRKVYLPSGGSLVIDRTEAMTVVDVNTGKFTGSGGNLEETVTKNNLEAAEEIVRQLRLRDIGGIVVIDFIDMVLESNRDLVLRRLVECLGRDRTKHQVAEVTSLGLVQMTRKRMGTGLLEVFSEPCEACAGRGILVHDQPLKGRSGGASDFIHRAERDDRKRYRNQKTQNRRDFSEVDEENEQKTEARRAALANIVAASSHHEEELEETESKSARKRKRRKRNRRAEGGLELENQQGQDARGEQVLTIGDEVIELPTGVEAETEENMGEQGSFTLESLAAVFDTDSDTETEERSEGRGRSRNQSKRRGGKKREDISADDFSVNSDASLDVDPEVDSRFTQNSSRLDAIRAGEARARASQKAGRDYEPREGEEAANSGERTGRNDRSGRADRTDRRGARNQNESGKGRTRKPRRASSSDVKYVAPIEVIADPAVTGVATPGKKAEVAPETPVEASAPAAAPSEAPRKKRRSRRAVSSGAGSTEVRTEEVQAASGSSVVASIDQAAKPAASSDDVPVMLGVGVSAADIKRAGK
ncbi:MAG: Rne/Rng family ribonuclease [Rothia sp. (in: high G+C Gram-positive bacteria)]|uniref:Rne/Rng family ribonuclease n=1 Tax=Rothia sp. (in: high G+C Gram-positive bacteria) TaxID=1885016 RepID=UPI0026F82E57|nr:Rne/Rng family ribonuclease [Rothia sp. (in: high G+C Gram-positive bacteria)]